MEINLVLNTAGEGIAGVDRQALIADIQAELDKLASDSKVSKATPVAEPPPPGAQGDASTIHWLLHLASDPAMARLYAQGLVFAVNSIISAASQRKITEKTEPSQKNQDQEGIAKLAVFGKEIILPATTAAIQLWLKSLGG